MKNRPHCPVAISHTLDVQLCFGSNSIVGNNNKSSLIYWTAGRFASKKRITANLENSSRCWVMIRDSRHDRRTSVRAKITAFSLLGDENLAACKS